MHEHPDPLRQLGDCGDTRPKLANPSGARCNHVPDTTSDLDHGIDDTQLECGGCVEYPKFGGQCRLVGRSLALTNCANE